MTFPKVLQKELDKPVKFIYIICLFSVIFTFDLTYYGLYVIAFIFIIFVLESASSGFKELYIPDLLTWIFILAWGIFEISQSFVKSDAFYYYNIIVLLPFIIFTIFNNSKLSIKDLDLFFNILFITGIILSYFSFSKLIEINYNFKYRITSTWDHYNLVAAFYMILLMFNLSFIVNSGKRKKNVFYIISFVLILMGMFMTQTRGIWLATLISVFYYVFRKPKLIVPILISLSVLVLLFYGIILDRVLSAVNFGYDISSLGRFQAWYASILLIKNNFLFGYGFDSFRYLRDSVITAYFVVLPHSHNTYLTLILDLGFIGFIFYISFFVKAFFYSMNIRKKIDNPELIKYVDGLQLSFVGLIIAFIFEPYFTVLGSINYMVWILISLSYYIRNNYRDGLLHS